MIIDEPIPNDKQLTTTIFANDIFAKLNTNEIVSAKTLAAFCASGGQPYSPPLRTIYAARIAQSGTSAPVATVLSTLIGNGTWSRSAAGKYACTFTPILTQALVLISFNPVDVTFATGVLVRFAFGSNSILQFGVDGSYADINGTGTLNLYVFGT